MPIRWTLRPLHISPAAERAIRRFGMKAGIVVAGTIIAAGSIHRASYLPHTPLAERLVANAPTNVKTPWGTTVSADSSIAPGGLDAGLDHDRIAYWVNRLTGSMKLDFAATLAKKAKFEPMIASKLQAKQMPRDLIYLAMIESEFNPNAKSPVKALGLWQFMSATARQFGLTVRGKVDERRDPARATDAAVQYLGKLHDRFGSWYLAAAAYNSGEGTVLKALRKATGRDTGSDEDFFRILPFLPKETQDYVPKLIAAARIGNAPAKYGVPVKDSVSNGDVSPAAKVDAPTVKRDATRTTVVKKATARAAVKKAATKASAKKASAKKAFAKKASAKKAAAKKATAKKAATKKAVATKAKAKKKP